jgi:hypothetical protein
MPPATLALASFSACGLQELLGALDLGAARKNCTADMLADSERFADVHERKADVAAALTHLQSLLPDIAKQLGVR